jgi:hypothetical protein
MNDSSCQCAQTLTGGQGPLPAIFEAFLGGAPKH